MRQKSRSPRVTTAAHVRKINRATSMVRRKSSASFWKVYAVNTQSPSCDTKGSLRACIANGPRSSSRPAGGDSWAIRNARQYPERERSCAEISAILKKRLQRYFWKMESPKKHDRFRAQVITASSSFGEMQSASGTAKLQLIHSGNGSDCALGMAIRSGL